MARGHRVASSSTSRSHSRGDRYGSSDHISRSYRRRRAYSSPSSDESDFSSRSSRHRHGSRRRKRRSTSLSSYGSSSYSSSYSRHRSRSRSVSSRDSGENTVRAGQKLRNAMASHDVDGALAEAVQTIRDSQGRMPRKIEMRDLICLCLKEGMLLALTSLLRAQRDELSKSRSGSSGDSRLQSRRDRPIKVSHLVAALCYLPVCGRIAPSQAADFIDAAFAVARLDPLGIAHPQFIGVAATDDDNIQVYDSDIEDESLTDSEDEFVENVANSVRKAREKALSFVRMRVRWATLELLEQTKIAVDEARTLDAESLSKSGTCVVFSELKAGTHADELKCICGDEAPRGIVQVGDSVMLSPVGEFEAAAKRAAAKPAAEVTKSVFERTAATAAAAALAQERLRDIKEKRATEVKHTEQMRAYHAHQAHQLASTQSSRRAQMDHWLASFHLPMQEKQQHTDALNTKLARERDELSQCQQCEAQQRLHYLTTLDRHLDELNAHASQVQQSLDDALAAELQMIERLSSNDTDDPLVVEADVLSIRPLTIRCRCAVRSVGGPGDLESQPIQRVRPSRPWRRGSSQNDDAADGHGGFRWIITRLINASSAAEFVEALVLAGDKRYIAPRGWRLDRVTNRVAFDQATKATCIIAAAAYSSHDVSGTQERLTQKRRRRAKQAMPWWCPNEDVAGILVGLPSESPEPFPARRTAATGLQSMHCFYDSLGVRCVLNQSQREAVTVVTTGKAPVTVVQGGFGTGKTAAVAVPILAFWIQSIREVSGDDDGLEKDYPQTLAVVQSKANADNLVRHLSLAQIDAVQISLPFQDFDDIRMRKAAESGRHSVGVAGSPAANELECGFDRTSATPALQWPKQQIRNRLSVLVASSTHAAVQYLKHARISYVLFDEAARATELSSLPLLSWGCQQLVLVGDQVAATTGSHPQGATPPSHVASLLERLLAEQACSQRARIPTIILTQQYRSHPAISKFPSKHFYGGSVQDSQETFVHAQSIRGYNWPRRDFPLSFVPLPPRTAESREAASFSNSVEALRIKEIFQGLINACDVSLATVGVVTFYAAQVKLLSTVLREFAGSGLEIGTVSAFQGREKRLIIVSTVRSNSNGEVGMLADWQWASIALTRARDALIVVGHAPTMASENRVWRPWLNWICSEGAVHGKPASVAIAFDEFFSPSLALPVALEAPESAQGLEWSVGPTLRADEAVSSSSGIAFPVDQKKHQVERELKIDSTSIPSRADAPNSSEASVACRVSKAGEGARTHAHCDDPHNSMLEDDDARRSHHQNVSGTLALVCHEARRGAAHQGTQPSTEKRGSSFSKPVSQLCLSKREEQERDQWRRADFQEKSGPTTKGAKETINSMTAETCIRREAEPTSHFGEEVCGSAETEAIADDALVEAAKENARKLSVEAGKAKKRAESAEAAAAVERALADRADRALADALGELQNLENRIFVDTAATDERAVREEGPSTDVARQATDVAFGGRAASPLWNTIPRDMGPASIQQETSAVFRKCAESATVQHGTGTLASTQGPASPKDASEDIPVSPINLEQKVLAQMQKLAAMEASVQRQLEAVRAATRKTEMCTLSKSQSISFDEIENNGIIAHVPEHNKAYCDKGYGSQQNHAATHNDLEDHDPEKEYKKIGVNADTSVIISDRECRREKRKHKKKHKRSSKRRRCDREASSSSDHAGPDTRTKTRKHRKK